MIKKVVFFQNGEKKSGMSSKNEMSIQKEVEKRIAKGAEKVIVVTVERQGYQMVETSSEVVFEKQAPQSTAKLTNPQREALEYIVANGGEVAPFPVIKVATHRKLESMGLILIEKSERTKYCTMAVITEMGKAVVAGR